jgi:DNA (cytosine-5)-methyltransferase 1
MVNLARPGVKIHFDTPERAEGFNRWLEKHMGTSKDAKGELIATAGTLAGDGWISNQPPWEPGCEHFWVADVRNLTGREILDALGLQPGEVDVCAGGPPCQGYSMAGARNVMDPRNSLVFEFARLVLEIRPKAFIMENVTGMLSMLTPQGVPGIDALCRVLADGGFGSYNALKSGLAAQAGAGAALRRDEQPKKARAARDDDDDPEDEQLGLFSLDGAA